MTKTLLKSIVRLIRETKGRFLSLCAIVCLGVAFFVGVSASSPIMGKSVDAYDDAMNLKDITVYSNYGFDEEDVERISEVEGVSGRRRLLSGYDCRHGNGNLCHKSPFLF